MDPPLGYVVSNQVRQIIFSATGVLLPSGVEGFMFQPVRTDTSNGVITSILTTITEVSLLNGSVITCSNGSKLTESQTITIAGEKSIIKHNVPHVFQQIPPLLHLLQWWLHNKMESIPL